MRPKHTGNCPWCEAHDVDLYMVTGVMDGRIIADWVCAGCVKALDMLRREKTNGKTDPTV